MLMISVLSLCSVAAASSYDYIVVGGGTSGLVIANRLSEDSSVSVLVVERGDSLLNNTLVSDPSNYGAAFGTPIDYAYQSVPQKYNNDKVQTLRAGKGLGGTSTINGMAYTRAEDVQINAWQSIGNKGWTWESLFPYYLKSQHFQEPTPAQYNAGANYVASYNGESGPLTVGWTYNMQNSSIHTELNETYQALGINYIPDVNGGKMHGYTMFPREVNRAENVREDAARAYYYPFDSRPNLSAVLNTTGNRIIWASDRSKAAAAIASGVEVTFSNGTVGTIYATKEVIISAGAFISPAILERSGVGNSAILSQFDIPVVVNLTTVGENLQDQVNTELIYSSDVSYTGPGTYLGHPSASDIFGSNTTNVANDIKNNLANYAARVSAASNGTMSAANLESLFRTQYELIFNSSTPIAEILVTPTGTKFISEYWGLLPFTRGNVHITSTDPQHQPNINPNYMMLEFDMQQQIEIGKFVRKLYNTAPLSNSTTGEFSPGYGTLPADATDAQWASWTNSAFRSNFHAVGTNAMMPKDMGGVVDTNLVVYGTANVRVVDASVVPFQVCGHSTSTLYAVAERAADLIKAGSK
uniref:glucose oxidase n=1 Tax=Aspergillus brunneouniseriatus TaxID=41724 RepID=A0A387JU68_9EURO|nr:FAD-dependent glucose dehydrogenase [Aspergillus brunneouniseriatus]BBE38583.1 FAD-dependent glucose dehydrogenase [synthetic construct]